MNARMLAGRVIVLASCAAVLSLGQFGCTNSDSKADPSAGSYAASGGIPPETPPPSEPQGDNLNVGEASSQGSPETTQEPAATIASEKKPASATPFTLEGADAETTSAISLPQLRPGLSPEMLNEFLAGADKDIQLIYSGRSGISDSRKARDTLIHFVKMKLEASRQLSAHTDANERAHSEGARGELQSLSHLAALGDLKAAEELEELAKANLNSKDAQLVSDSRLVLIGFAIESLQNGEENAADRIVSYVKQIAASETQADVPAMMTMGQARESLANYGHESESQQVRDMIIDLFADSPQPEIAQMAAQLAGNVRFDAIHKLHGSAMRGETVSADLWREATETLIDESADLQTVRYLAGSALEFESLGLSELAEVTYDVMATRFTDPASATAREVQTAMEARQARQEIVGWVFDLDLPQVDGSPLSMNDYRGQVVLMPFWAMASPESLQLIGRLKTIRDSHPDKVAIVGINLDAEGAPVEEFLGANDLGFPSFRAETSATAKIANPVGVQFGVVSMPFIAILDHEGRVAAINFTGHDLEKIVGELVDR